jgi:hypothetical protein
MRPNENETIIDMKNPYNLSISENVVELACKLHREAAGLLIDVPRGIFLDAKDLPALCTVKGNTLEFASLAARNIVVASSVFTRLMASSTLDVDELFDSAYDFWRREIGDADQASGHLIAQASESIDILAAGAQRIQDGADVFDVLHLLEAAMPYTDKLAINSIINLCSLKHELIKNDMMGGAFHGVLETWLATRPDSAKELHSNVLNNLTESTASLLGNAIAALSKSDFPEAVRMAKADINSGISMRAGSGAWTLGRLLLDERASTESVIELVNAIKNSIATESGDIRSELIKAAVGAMHKIPDFDGILEELAESGDQEVLRAAARSLFINADALHERGMTQRWFSLLAALRPEFKGALRDFDYALSQALADTDKVQYVIETISEWVANFGEKTAIDSQSAETFKGTVRTLFADHKYSASLITDWILREGPEYPAALAGILSQISHDLAPSLAFDISTVNQLTASDLMFVARRMLGYVHDREQLTSVSLSLLNANDAENRIYPILRALLVDEIGYDYPSSTADALRQYAANRVSDIHSEFLIQLADIIVNMLQTREALPLLNELKPPTTLSRLFARARAKQMSASFEEANKNSAFRQLVTEIPLKAGGGNFNYRNSDYGTTMKLSTISHSIELPRREMSDPIGNALRHFGFRIAKRGNP